MKSKVLFGKKSALRSQNVFETLLTMPLAAADGENDSPNGDDHRNSAKKSNALSASQLGSNPLRSLTHSSKNFTASSEVSSTQSLFLLMLRHWRQDWTHTAVHLAMQNH